MSDKKYREYISTLPSCISGRFSEYLNGEGRNTAHHVRRSNNSGTGIKGDFICVPVTFDEHHVIHTAGELSVILRFGQGRTGILDCSLEGARHWFDRKVEIYKELWERHNAKS